MATVCDIYIHRVDTELICLPWFLLSRLAEEESGLSTSVFNTTLN